MTGQSLLDRMELLNQELQLQAGEADVTRGLVALNVAQDLFENLAASQPDFLGGQEGTVATVANQEYTLYPTGLLRLDGLDFIDPNTNRPSWPITNAHHTGSHAYYTPVNLSVVLETERPQIYWTNGTRIYWGPVPQAIHTIRWYGFQRQSDITASGTFAYDDGIALPLALLAVQLMKIGVDDPATDVAGLANQIINPLLQNMGAFNRDGASPLRYREQHLT